MIKTPYQGFINTSPLFKNELLGVKQFNFPILDLETFQPKPIPNNLRLGHQMEHVFHQLVTYSGIYEITVHNLPVRANKRTLGEIDFILKNKQTDESIHVELTYKFYIINPEEQEPIHQLIGPNKRDAFFAKISKIKNVQFPLLHSKEGAKALFELGVDHTRLKHHCCFKAQLFQPYHKAVNINRFNDDCIVGRWLRINDFKGKDFDKATYYVPTKSEWVNSPHDQKEWKPHPEALAEIKLMHLKEKAPMVWVKRTKTEFEKLFVVWW